MDKAIAEARYRALRREMTKTGLDALIMVSRGEPGHRGAIRFVADYYFLVRTVYAVIFSTGDPILVTTHRAEQHQARLASGLQDVEFAIDPAPAIASILERRGGSLRRVGIAGMRSTIPLGHYLEIVRRCPGIQFVDAAEVFEAARAVKSGAELEMARHSSEIADTAYRHFLEIVKPGIREIDLQAEIERIERTMGACEMLTLISAGPKNAALAIPSQRRLELGDLVTFWVELAGPEGFWVERGGMVSIGEQSGEARMLFEVCLTAMTEAAKELRPGVRASEVAARIKKEATEAGLVLGAWSGHGIGLDVIEAPTIASDDETVLQEGMLVSLHPHVVTPDRSNGGHTGDVYIVRPHGGEALSGLPHVFHVA